MVRYGFDAEIWGSLSPGLSNWAISDWMKIKKSKEVTVTLKKFYSSDLKNNQNSPTLTVDSAEICLSEGRLVKNLLELFKLFIKLFDQIELLS